MMISGSKVGPSPITDRKEEAVSVYYPDIPISSGQQRIASAVSPDYINSPIRSNQNSQIRRANSNHHLANTESALHPPNNPMKSSNSGQYFANVGPQPQRRESNLLPNIRHASSRHLQRNSVRSAFSSIKGPRFLRRESSVESGILGKQVAMMYDVFLNIRGDNDDIMSLKRPVADLVKEYQEYKVKNCNLALTVVVTIILLVYFIVEHYSTYGAFKYPMMNPFMTVSLSLSVVCFSLLIVTGIHRVFILTDCKNPYFQPLKRLCLRMCQPPLTMRLMNDCLPIVLAVRTGFTMLGRSGVGACDQLRLNTSLQMYDCNEGSIGQGIPPVLLPQMFIKGASRGAICVAW